MRRQRPGSTHGCRIASDLMKSGGGRPPIPRPRITQPTGVTTTCHSYPYRRTRPPARTDRRLAGLSRPAWQTLEKPPAGRMALLDGRRRAGASPVPQHLSPILAAELSPARLTFPFLQRRRFTWPRLVRGFFFAAAGSGFPCPVTGWPAPGQGRRSGRAGPPLCGFSCFWERTRGELALPSFDEKERGSACSMD